MASVEAGSSLDAGSLSVDDIDATSSPGAPSSGDPDGAGAGLPVPDTGTGSAPDLVADDSGLDGGRVATGLAAPSPGELLISEIMFDPSGPVPGSEWFEVYNPTDSPRLLSGLTIRDGLSRTHVIADNPPIIAPPWTFVLLVRDRIAAEGSLVPPATVVYEYGAGLADNEGIELAAGTVSELSLWNGTTVIADVPYGSWGLAAPGQSVEFAATDLAVDAGGGGTDLFSSWCVAQAPWTDGSDWGTPGANSDCP